MDFDANLVAVLLAPGELRGELGRFAQRQHLFDLDANGHRLRRQAEGLAGGRQRDLAETGAGHDRLAVHLVVEQVGNEFGPDIGREDVLATGRQLDVRAQQRMSAGRLPVRRERRRPVADVQPRRRRQVDEFLCAAVDLRAAATDGGRTVASWVWNVSVSGLSRVSVAATWAPPRGLADSSVPLMAWLSSGCGLTSTKVEWFSAALATAWLNRTGLRRLTTQ